MSAEHPPAFEPVSAIELQSVADSKIISVSLYSSLAEITRLFKFTVKTGLNHVGVSGLPSVLEADSLRVEGRGAATIHDVTVSSAKDPDTPATSPELTELLGRREKTASALARCEKSLSSLEKYLDTLTVEHLDVSKLGSVMEHYDSTGEKLHARKSELTEQLRVVEADIQRERLRIALPHEHDKLRMKVAIGVFAETDGNVEIALIYAVPRASWTAFYDIRVDMNSKDDQITFVYKAAIRQRTGESWNDVPLTLETSTPTFGLDIPQLQPWNLEVMRFMPRKSKSLYVRNRESVAFRATDALKGGAPGAAGDYNHSDSGSVENDVGEMRLGGAAVTSRGNVSATFRVPGLVSIPSDGEAHNFTIVQLTFKAEMSWVSVPKIDTKAHINARITNASDYTLLGGTASVYVDGSFISRSYVPSVSPKESFDCPLGVDPSIRITYHPVVKKKSQSGFYTKSATHVFSQRIAVHNTKGVAVERLKIVDQIPVSRDSQIEVKLVAPALTLPSESSGGGNSVSGFGSTLKTAKPKAAAPPQKLDVARGVVAQWDGTDEPDCAVESLGLDRKLNWICAVPSQGKLNLSLDWEVTVSPASAQIVGL
ncbi:hypothetical protein GGX14DRAFT_522742 [Mycena pura]|uniref:Mucoidy inhibitor A n=1 Tax=Mycena pura TaxID=153505 RepID=A0AAD6VBT5_9AGAR|nr:hypothetical protein GGX14DRAFT_522742 [Mycena pura]